MSQKQIQSSRNIYIYKCIVFSLVGLTALSAIILLSSRVSASDSYTTEVNISIPTSCTISSNDSSYNTTILSGHVDTITGSSITATCNDAAGYAIYAIGYSGNSYTADSHTDMIASLGSNYNIKTNGTNGASYWKMKLDNTNNVDATIENNYGSFQSIPASYTKIVSNSGTTSAASITPIYQIYIGENQVAGSYVGKVKYTLLHPSTMTPAESPELAYTITYNANGGSGTMTSSTMVPIYADFTLPTSTFTAPSGYEFAGWCTTNTAGSYACDGTSYTSTGLIPAGTVAAGGTLNLYAVWQSSGGGSSSAIGYCITESAEYCMQDVANWAGDLDVGDEVTAMDGRDGKTYTVALLEDDNIWMTQNLDHDIVSTTDFYTYDNTDIGHGSTPNTNAKWTGTATYATGVTTWNGSATAPESYDPGDLCWNGTLDSNFSTTLSKGTTACGDDKHYHIGNYYNWTAAVAMNDSSSYTTDDTDVNQSICPAGWRLPIGGTSNTGSKSFQYLAYQLDLKAGNIQNSPVYFVYGGVWNGLSYGVGSVSIYWSSVVNDSDNAYGFAFDVNGTTPPQLPFFRYIASSVRCVAR